MWNFDDLDTPTNKNKSSDDDSKSSGDYKFPATDKKLNSMDGDKNKKTIRV